MSCLSSSISISISRTIIFASLTNNSPPNLPPGDIQPPLPPINPSNPLKRRNKQQPPSLPKSQSQQQKRQNPSVIQLQRAIGAGSYRDSDSPDSDQRNSLLDGFSSSGGDKWESPVEKKLRETGEWISAGTETRFRLAGKGILLVVIQWILPIWTLSLLVASGAIKLPFKTPFLDDLIM